MAIADGEKEEILAAGDPKTLDLEFRWNAHPDTGEIGYGLRSGYSELTWSDLLHIEEDRLVTTQALPVGKLLLSQLRLVGGAGRQKRRGVSPGGWSRGGRRLLPSGARCR